MPGGANPATGAAAPAGAQPGQQAQAGQQPPRPGDVGAGNITIRNPYGAGVLGVSYRPGEPRPANLIVSGLASFRLRPHHRATNNNNADAQNNNTVNAAGEAVGGNNNNTGPVGLAQGRLGFAWNQADTIIGNIRNIALALRARRIANGPENNTAGQGGVGGNGTGGVSGDAPVGDASQQLPQQHHHHHHHHHVHRRLPTIMNLAHLQRISLGRITISPQFTGLVNGTGTTTTTAQPAENGGASPEAGTAQVVTTVENNGCNESESASGSEQAMAESGPETESNARRQESDPRDDALLESGSGGGAMGDLITGATATGDKLLSQAGVEGERAVAVDGSMDKLNSVEMDSKVERSSLGINSGAGEIATNVQGLPDGSSDQKTRERKLGVDGVVSSIATRKDDDTDAIRVDSSVSNELPRLGQRQVENCLAGSHQEVVVDSSDWRTTGVDIGSVGEGATSSVEVGKLVNLNVNYNQSMLSSTLNSAQVPESVGSTVLEQRTENGQEDGN